jgi:ABC-type amino acid transport substrate-binding protein
MQFRSAGPAAVLLVMLAGLAGPAAAESTLEKVGRTGVFVVGTRTGSPPFAFVGKDNQWGGFSVDLARLVHAAVEKKVARPVRFALKESTPATRIALLETGVVDLIAGTMTITRTRRESVDFSLAFFVTGAQFLVRKGSPIHGLRDIGGRRIAVLQGSTQEKAIRERQPSARLSMFSDQPAAFAALSQGKVDAYSNDGVQLAGLRAKSANPAEWEVVGDFYTYEPYGMALRRNDSEFRNLVDATLMEALESGAYQKLYDRWFGQGELAYPLSETARIFMQMQVVPR